MLNRQQGNNKIKKRFNSLSELRQHLKGQKAKNSNGKNEDAVTSEIGKNTQERVNDFFLSKKTKQTNDEEHNSINRVSVHEKVQERAKTDLQKSERKGEGEVENKNPFLFATNASTRGAGTRNVAINRSGSVGSICKDPFEIVEFVGASIQKEDKIDVKIDIDITMDTDIYTLKRKADFTHQSDSAGEGEDEGEEGDVDGHGDEMLEDASMYRVNMSVVSSLSTDMKTKEAYSTKKAKTIEKNLAVEKADKSNEMYIDITTKNKSKKKEDNEGEKGKNRERYSDSDITDVVGVVGNNPMVTEIIRFIISEPTQDLLEMTQEHAILKYGKYYQERGNKWTDKKSEAIGEILNKLCVFYYQQENRDRAGYGGGVIEKEEDEEWEESIRMLDTMMKRKVEQEKSKYGNSDRNGNENENENIEINGGGGDEEMYFVVLVDDIGYEFKKLKDKRRVRIYGRGVGGGYMKVLSKKGIVYKQNTKEREEGKNRRVKEIEKEIELEVVGEQSIARIIESEILKRRGKMGIGREIISNELFVNGQYKVPKIEIKRQKTNYGNKEYRVEISKLKIMRDKEKEVISRHME